MSSVICISSDEEETKEESILKTRLTMNAASADATPFDTKASEPSAIPKIVSATSLTEEEFNSMPAVEPYAVYGAGRASAGSVSKRDAGGPSDRDGKRRVVKRRDRSVRKTSDSIGDVDRVPPISNDGKTTAFIDTVTLNDDGDDEEYELDRHTRRNLVTSVPRPKLVSPTDGTKKREDARIDANGTVPPNRLAAEDRPEAFDNRLRERSDARKPDRPVPLIKVRNIDSLIERKTAPGDRFALLECPVRETATRRPSVIENTVTDVIKKNVYGYGRKNHVNGNHAALKNRNGTSPRTPARIDISIDYMKVSGKTIDDAVSSCGAAGDRTRTSPAARSNRLSLPKRNGVEFEENAIETDPAALSATRKQTAENPTHKTNDGSRAGRRSVTADDGRSGKKSDSDKKENEDEILVVYEGISSDASKIVDGPTCTRHRSKRKIAPSFENRPAIKRMRSENEAPSEIVLIDDDEDAIVDAKEPPVPSEDTNAADRTPAAVETDDVTERDVENVIIIADEEAEIDTTSKEQKTSDTALVVSAPDVSTPAVSASAVAVPTVSAQAVSAPAVSALADSEPAVGAEGPKRSDAFEEFVSACTSDSISEKLLRFVNEHVNKLRVRYRNADPEYLTSKSFVELMKKCTERVRSRPRDVLINFNEVLQELKARQLSDDDGRSDCVDPKKRKHVRKLERTLKLLRNKIRELSEKEIDWDDEEDSYYLQEERYKKRCVLVYEKLCELTGEDKNAGRQTRAKLRVKCSRYTEINRAVSKLYRRTKRFPNIDDIETCVRACVVEHGIAITPSELSNEIQNIFKTVGNILQQRRKLELYENLNDPNDLSVDPAEQDSELSGKLERNKEINDTNMEKVIKKYVEMQEKGEDRFSENEHSSEDDACEDRRNSDDGDDS